MSLLFKPLLESAASTSKSVSWLKSPASISCVDKVGGGRWGAFRAHLSSRQAHTRIKSDIRSVLPSTMANMIWPLELRTRGVQDKGSCFTY